MSHIFRLLCLQEGDKDKNTNTHTIQQYCTNSAHKVRVVSCAATVRMCWMCLIPGMQ